MNIKRERIKQSNYYHPKISETLLNVLENIEREDIVRENSNQFDMSQFSNFLVHVDKEGRIQVYILLDTVNSSDLATLEENNVTIEISNEELKTIQGWIPFHSFVDVASITNVQSITQPSYAAPR